ncbi:hypothetical protein Htur_3340 [Haloterrigena turkmenica DSM 5511]|uniref:HTH iclR-type domain-containing protein n=1 Tax=Haloterrigena turkmenica (strain ATCC 51198 / DSM 5511 / JCM 9101 / NCIMB 13204 / VKM B-1734 / 4k) TaxID=543526 RepID=D2RPQ2_HALTV|nr:hypothetical protein [Haloterrigena turkmenica]ADB62204.1 hypothetical protein Htur_3340 [Haloterrigena turkmenica DSM 5511]
MRLSTAVALALSVLLAALTVGTVVIAPATAATSTADESAALSASQSRLASATLESSVQDADQEYQPERADTRQVIRLNVTEDGDVRWTLESRFRLSENETDQFKQYAESVANSDVGYDVKKYDQARVLAERSTGREMAFENESWNDPRIESRNGQKLGIISYSFTWTNFAVVDGQQVHFGDAFVTDDGGVWLRSLEDGQRLVVESPPNYGFEAAPTGIENGTIVYEGPKSFTEGDFEMELFRTDSPGGSGGTPSEPDPLSESVFTAEGIAAAFGGFVLVIVGAALLVSRYQRSAWPFDDESPTGAEYPRATETDGSGTAFGASRTDPPGIEHEFDETEAVDAGPDGDTDDVIDEELLSDDERVRRLLEQNGGRMKQATIVKETGWSDAKVSQLLSEMDDDDRIRKLRIGRENLITLPDIDPTEID